ncbi:vWA domain-containing protein [Rhizobium sp. SAFR-030]|uniref:vWA domain-containing protein n=1 Tax=Rhizobium sp. SAFR-030 TaxID=3387277 RepID=UPI003F802444
MFIPFFLKLKDARVPVTLREFLDLLEGMEAGLADFDVEAFYFLARAALVKDERHIDRFDQVFSTHFSGLEAISGIEVSESEPLPEEWLRKLAERHLSAEEKALVASLGGFEALMEMLRKRLEEQQGRHQGGSKWIGTAGTSPFGAYGYNPEGVRIGQKTSRHRRAVKVWDSREFRDFDDAREIGTRNIKVALKRLRRWVREGAADELDLPGTIRSTAEHGYLDVQTRPERRNSVKLLMFFDVGGSMDDHVAEVEELFSAARSEFRHLEHFYFHNCLYESVWRDNRRRSTRLPVTEILRTYGPDYRIIFVGDATMSPYEISHPGGSVEHWNKEAGEVWMGRMTAHFRRVAWINPVAEPQWDFTQSAILMRRILDGRMYPLTLSGLEQAMRSLSR